MNLREKKKNLKYAGKSKNKKKKGKKNGRKNGENRRKFLKKKKLKYYFGTKNVAGFQKNVWERK